MENDFLTTEELCGFTEEGYDDELWGLIPGYENYYVSTKGRVWSITYGDFLKPNIGTHGYPYVNLSSNGKCRTRTIHRLEALTFIPNPDNSPVVRHLNDSRTDNRVENLAWGTYSDNMDDAIRNGGWDNILRPIIAINNDTGIGFYYISCNEASRDLGYTVSAVNTGIINGWNIGGYRFEDADPKYLHDGIRNGDVVRHIFPTQKMKQRPHLTTKVLCIRCDDGEEMIFDNINEVVNFFNSPYQTIMSAIHLKLKHKGFYIEYMY